MATSPEWIPILEPDESVLIRMLIGERRAFVRPLMASNAEHPPRAVLIDTEFPHPLFLFAVNDPDGLHRAEHAGAEILKLCGDVGGCLTGEHGVGIEKRDLMAVQFSQADMEAQMRVKDVFDPAWLLNPAKVFPLELSARRRAGG